jgi:hypothetical protein
VVLNTVRTVFLRLQTCVLNVSTVLIFNTIAIVLIKTCIQMESTLVALEAFVVISAAWIPVDWAAASDTRSRLSPGLVDWSRLPVVEAVAWKKAHEAKLVLTLCTRCVVARLLEFEKHGTLWAWFDAGSCVVECHVLQVRTRSIIAAYMAGLMFMLAVKAG